MKNWLKAWIIVAFTFGSAIVIFTYKGQIVLPPLMSTIFSRVSEWLGLISVTLRIPYAIDWEKTIIFALAVAGLPAAFIGVIQLVEWYKGASKKETIRAKFQSYLDNVSEELAVYASRTFPKDRLPYDPKLIVAKNLDATRGAIDLAKEKIKTHIEKGRGVRILEIQGGRKQGKSSFLWRLAKEASLIPKINARWGVKEGLSFSSNEVWVDFLNTIELCARVRGNSPVLIFWDVPLDSISPALKSSLKIFSYHDLWDAVRRRFSNNRKNKFTIVFVSTSGPMYQYSQPRWFDTRIDEEEEVKESRRDYYASINLNLSVSDFQLIISKYSNLKGYSQGKLESFLCLPGVYEKGRGSILFLLYLFEQYVNPTKMRFVLDDENRRNLEIYDSWADGDTKKRVVRMVALSNLLNYLVPGTLFNSVSRNDIETLENMFLSEFQGQFVLTVPFIGYVLLQEESENCGDFSQYIEKVVGPWVDIMVDNLMTPEIGYPLDQSIFLRDLIHSIDEEQYRPILQYSGHETAKTIFNNRKEKILRYIHERLLPGLEGNPNLIWGIRKWASTFQRFGLHEVTERMYDRVLPLIYKLKGKQRAKILIPLAKGMAHLNAHKYKSEIVSIYNEFLIDHSTDMRWINVPRLLADAIDVYLRMKWTDEALGLMDKTVIEWRKDSLLTLYRGKIFQDMGRLREAEEMFRQNNILTEKPHASSTSRFNSLHRYAIFLIKNNLSLSPDDGRPSIESLLSSAERIAFQMNNQVEAVYGAWGDYYRFVRKNYTKALEMYKKAVEWCKRNGIPNARPYNKLANFLMETSHYLPILASDSAVEAETWLRTVIEGGDFDHHSKRHAYNIIGRLVAGAVRNVELREDGPHISPIQYVYFGKQRPNYDEAIEYLRNSYECLEEFDYSDPIRKTWQDIRTHKDISKIYEYKASIEKDVDKKVENLKMAKKYLKAAFEGLPREDLCDATVKQHVLSAMDAYAHLSWKIVFPAYSEEADSCWRELMDKMEAWGLDKKESFPYVWEIYQGYGHFLARTKLQRVQAQPGQYQLPSSLPQIPLTSVIKDYDGEEVAKEIVKYYRLALVNMPEDKYILPKRITMVRFALIFMRALTQNAIVLEKYLPACFYLKMYLEFFENIFNGGISEDSKLGRDLFQYLNKFIGHPKIDNLLQLNPLLYAKTRSIQEKFSTSRV